MARLSGKQYKQLEEALRSAFTSVRAVERMVKHCLDEDLSEIVDLGNLSDVIFDLIKWAEAQGRIDELITEAHNYVPKNQELNSFYDSYEKQLGDSGQQRETKNTNERSNRNKKTLKFKMPQSGPLENEKRWLKNFGFESSPFTGLYSTSAEHADPSFLSNCFMDPDCLFDILGQASIPFAAILYGEPGEGKTACRVMVDYLCLHGGVPDIGSSQQAYVLSVPHVDMYKISKNPTLEQHVVEILGRAMPQFVDLLVQEEIIKYNLTRVSAHIFAELNWYIDFYNKYLSIQQVDGLSRLGIKVPFDFSTYPSLENRSAISPVDHLRHWCNLLFELNIKAVYVLIDGFDDTGALTIDAAREEAFNMLAPLLRNRDLIDKIPHFALKCFVPTYMKEKILTDKLSNYKFMTFYPIKWTKEKMIELLRQRILFFRRDDYPVERAGFGDLCVTELAGIEETLIDIAGCNPRHLLMLCDLMVKAHCRAGEAVKGDSFKLTSDDFADAQNEFSLWLNRHNAEPIDNISEVSDQLSDTEFIENENDITSSQSVQQVKESKDGDVLALIGEGENYRVEFKSSMLRDISTDEENKGLIYELGKEIAGMLNSSGGFILVGVDDEGAILGIEGDYEFLGRRDKKRPNSKKQNVDGYGLKLYDLIKHQLGPDVPVNFSFRTLENKTICVIEIQPSSKPAYFGKAEDFFIRRGTSKDRLSPSQIVSYTREHWPK